MPPILRRLSLAAALLAAAFAASANPAVPLGAPNVVEITPKLTTAGQPTPKALAELKARGFEAVIYLAPPTVGDAVKDEQFIVTGQGLTFVNIPIIFSNPTEADFEMFAAVMRGLAGRKVLVHCQVNMRASVMTFLYRSIVLKEDPRQAYESVSRVWVPSSPWKKLIEAQLRKHQVAFEPF